MTKKLILLLATLSISFNAPGAVNPDNAMEKYCPGFCCPDIGDSNPLLLDEIMQYCEDHPKATQLSPKLHDWLNIEYKVRRDYFNDFPDNPLQYKKHDKDNY